MPGPTQEKQAAALANQIISLAQSLYNISGQITAAANEWTNVSAAAKLNAFPTSAVLTTGELGAADVTPNVAHIIDPRTALGGLLTVALSANDIAGLLTFLQGVNNAIGGQAVSANGAAVQLLAKCL